MRIDPESLAQRHREAKEQLKRDRLPDLRLVAQAKVEEAVLTRSPEWDSFLQVCQAILDRANEEARQWAERLASDPFVDPNQLISLRLLAESANSRVNAITEIMSLPKRLKVAGEHAEAIIEEMESDGAG